MKIVEFGDDGSPKLLKQGEPPAARETPGDGSRIKIRDFSTEAASSPAAAGAAEPGRIKIREFGAGMEEGEARKAPGVKAGPFGAARAPQNIKIVDFDKEKGRSQPRPAPALERPRGMKIVESE